MKSSTPKAAASVTYALHAKLYRGDALLASHVQKIHIFDCSEIAPPLVVEDFASEYNLCQESLLRRGIVKKCGRMLFRAAQPDALIFSDPRATATTKVLLHVTYNKAEASSQHDEPEAFEASVNWKLQSSTIVCMHMPDAIPTIRQVNSSLSMAHISKTNSTHHLKMEWSKWRRTSRTDSGCTEWTGSFPIWLVAESSLSLPPTFSLPYLSRRYSVLLELSVSGLCRAKAALRLPIQVAYHSTAAPTRTSCQTNPVFLAENASSRSPPLHSLERQELPPYVR